MTEDILSGDFTTDEIPFVETRFFRAIRTGIYLAVRAAIAYCIAYGFWYLTVAANSLAQYSRIAETGRILLFIGIFLLLFITGDEKDV